MVTKAERLIYEQVLERDRLLFWEWVLPLNQTSFAEWKAHDPWVCAARTMAVIASQESGLCSGVMTRDHVHTHTGGTKGKRPETSMETVLILCSFHHLNSPWAVTHRPRIRTYIKEANERYRVFADRGGPA
jgi:hypothetical protein